jgi:hypothetical protein
LPAAMGKKMRFPKLLLAQYSVSTFMAYF